MDYDWRSEFCKQRMVVGHKCLQKDEKDEQLGKALKRGQPLKTVTQEWRHKGLAREHKLPVKGVITQPKQVHPLKQKDIQPAELQKVAA